MNLLVITGEMSPGGCGICDYNKRMLEELADKETLQVTTKCYKEISRYDLKQANAVFLNYPCPHFEKNFKVHAKLLAAKLLGCKIIYGMHEYSYVHTLRRAAIFLFLLMADRVFSVTKQEIARLPGFIRKKTVFVPISSNVHTGGIVGEPFRSEPGCITVSYFGVFYPAKKIEKLILAAKQASKEGYPVNVRLIGARHPSHLDYVTALESLVEEAGLADHVSWHFECEENEVVRLLHSSDICVLPYEEGVTMRRGTFLTCLELGVPVITTSGADTPQELLQTESIFFADDVKGIAGCLKHVFQNPDSYRAKARITREKLGLASWKEVGRALERIVLS